MLKPTNNLIAVGTKAALLLGRIKVGLVGKEDRTFT